MAKKVSKTYKLGKMHLRMLLEMQEKFNSENNANRTMTDTLETAITKAYIQTIEEPDVDKLWAKGECLLDKSSD